MSDYISREAVVEKICHELKGDLFANTEEDYIAGCKKGMILACSIVYRFPPADVAPVVHARCIVNCDGDTSCSNCGEKWIDHTKNYCPECGARLDLEVVYE